MQSHKKSGVQSKYDKERSLMVEDIKEIYEAVNSILIIAIANNETLHLDVKYSAFINEIEVKAFSRNTDYSKGHKRKFSCGVYLDNPNALKRLKSLENELKKLIEIEKID